MDVLHEIIENSAIGPYSLWSKGLVISIFSSIVCALATMFVLLMLHGPAMSIQFGY
ncbi:hypothetical protein ABV409_08400 [Flagellimonas sp. DF-77]|uniref:hypothetical protein n=1 Tax=Flagellimonas algarum TaxID=3230298 RepID=UPI0033929FCB